MDVATASQIVNSPAAYLLLAIIVSVTAYKFFIVVYNRMTEEKLEKEKQIKALYEQQAQDAREREEQNNEHQSKLLSQLDQSTKNQERLAEAVEHINASLVSLNDRLNSEIKVVHNRVDDLQLKINQQTGGVQ